MPKWAEFAWVAFWRLNADRPMITTGMGIPMGGTIIEPRAGRIPFGAIDAYARRYGMEGGGFDLLLGLIEPMDREYLAWDAERAAERAQRRG